MKYSGLIYGYLIGMFGQAILFDKWSNKIFWVGQIIGLSVMIIVWIFLNKSIFKNIKINKSDKNVNSKKTINKNEKTYTKYYNCPKK